MKAKNQQSNKRNIMNCAECRDNLVACLEGLLEAEQSRECQAHLESCAACRAEYGAISRFKSGWRPVAAWQRGCRWLNR